MWQLYRILAYFGLASIFGTILCGFAYHPAAPRYMIGLNVLLYVAYIVPHLVMTRAWFKRAVWGQPGGSHAERRVYITIASVLWIGVYAIQRLYLPMPGFALQVPEWVQFAGVVAVILSMRSFFEGSTIEMLDGLFAMPGAPLSHSHGAETPLLTTGPYARVRHPHYQALVLACASTLLIHPNAAQLLWAAMIAATFVLFIPIEEAQLISARGDAYRDYQRQTRYRLFRGVW
jgi:protein-S-isoprenylcysteine O-methyltransferase Ste14